MESSSSSVSTATPVGVTPDYDDRIVKMFFTATVIWGIVGMLVGVIIALQLTFWQANLGPWLSFGRLRPLHTNAVIFAFAGNVCFTGIYHSMQRLLKTRMFNDTLSRIHFWGWQLIIVSAAVTLPLGMTQSKEYAELIWPIDVAITLVWVVFGINFFGTVARRKVQHLYVAIWFYMSFVITIAVLHIFNSLAIPATLFRSYPIYTGLTDALVQWWYGHNAVGFFLTTPFLGLMYYYLPRAAERPVYSYRLSIIHFWALVFLYIWAGPHHLLFSALPDWAQTLGMVFSIMLIAPSWGGMLNGLLTLRGAWDRVRTDPVLKMMVVAVSFYGMSTFEGPMMSIRAVNGLAHYTNWVIGHVHSGALGWVGMMSFGMLYWLVPRLYKRELWKPQWAEAHFWLATIGIVLYTVAMWAAGLMEGLQWRAINDAGQLANPIFLDITARLQPFLLLRVVGGSMYLVGAIMMGINFWKTVRGSDEAAQTPASVTA
ncbi:MAG: cytochrome-c oxidase, cbb3-type subunit I [Gemmatimonadales bacterium]|jgi:cytochrome c oxidase cbb3-type subunit I/II|nr:MAG: cytochrome-c oxidase, cbb3-type subunit I [Gemmatimonadales bacterium]